MQLTPEAWARHADLARLRGYAIGRVGQKLIHHLRRWQDELVYSYHRGDWWQLNVWNPLLDDRIPQRDHEPQGRVVVNFTHLTSPWLREAAKWWLGDTLASGRYTWSSLKSRNDGLKWLQRHIDATADDGPALVADPDDLRRFVRAFLDRLRAYRITAGPSAGQPLAGNPHRQILVATEQFYAYMFDNRAQAARELNEPRWLDLTSAHSVLFRTGDKPRFTNKKSDVMYLEDEVVAKIAARRRVARAAEDRRWVRGYVRLSRADAVDPHRPPDQRGAPDGFRTAAAAGRSARRRRQQRVDGGADELPPDQGAVDAVRDHSRRCRSRGDHPRTAAGGSPVRRPDGSD